MSYCASHISAPLSRKDHQWLCEAVSAASAKWRNFGMALKFSYHELGAIVNERSLTTDEHYMQELLSRWLKWAPPNHPLPCVEDLATALCSVGEERTAYDLYMYLESNGYVLHASATGWCMYSFKQTFHKALDNSVNLSFAAPPLGGKLKNTAKVDVPCSFLHRLLLPNC